MDITNTFSLEDLMKGITLLNYTDNHKKFWTIQYQTVTPSQGILIRTWGRINTSPQRKETIYNCGEAFSEAYKLLVDKHKKGYRLEKDMLAFFLNRVVPV